MTAELANSQPAGPLGPVALSGGALLLAAAPLMRGGNRHVALIGLELVALLTLAALASHALMTRPNPEHRTRRNPLVWLLLLSPLLLALVQLFPIPASVWVQLPGRALYAQTLADAGISAAAWRPLSVSPDATWGSLLAGIPVATAFLLGYLATLLQLRLMLRVVVAVALLQVTLGLLQIAGGEQSPLFFGTLSFGPPIGTFANRNHFANYLAMALAALIWLAYESHREARGRVRAGSFGAVHRTTLWSALGLVLLLGIILSRSRGGALFGLPAATLALVLVSLRLNGWSRGWRYALPLVLLLVVAAVSLVGFDAATSRLTSDQLASSAGFRGELARTSFEGAMAFWPWGAGWGSYDLAYQRFQPLTLPGYAVHAHMDYVEMLFEGGVFAVVLAAAFFWLAAGRATTLVRSALRHAPPDREAMAAALCGCGLLGLLLHSLVEFNMRIPANAILGALLAGAYLRPLPHSSRSALEK